MEFLKIIYPLAFQFFLIANPIGNAPAIVALVKHFDLERQKKIILREALFALALALFFQFFGVFFLSWIGIEQYALTLTGGILLFLVALGMIFNLTSSVKTTEVKQEPFIVPIATPIITGPALMAMIMVSSADHPHITLTAAILLAWVGILLVLGIAPYLKKLMGDRGLSALEQLMGMILAFMSMQMLVDGLNKFLKL